MGRHIEGKKHAGSQKWLQVSVNDHTELLDTYIAPKLHPQPSSIEWLSPLRSDDYAEYSDDDFINRLGVTLDKKPLGEFWPKGGPHWDALGMTMQGQILLVEAKSYIKEMAGHNRRCRAKPQSRRIIENASTVVKNALGANPDSDWLGDHYQYANRLAHLFLLRVLNDLPAYLIMLYFLNDVEQDGPSEPAEWEAAIREEEHCLGIPETHALSDFVVPVFVDVISIRNQQ